MKPTAMQRMVAARTTMILDEPFWGTLAMRLRLLEDPTCPTAWVDGRTLGFNPAFVDTLTQKQIVALVAHEVGHCALGHPFRRGRRDPLLWNEAADRTLNPILRDAGFELPEGALFELEPSHRGKSSEWVYDRLPQPPEPEPQQQPPQQDDAEDDSSDDDEDEQQQQQGGGAAQDEQADDDAEDDSSDDDEDEQQQQQGGGAAQDEQADDDAQQDAGRDGDDDSQQDASGGAAGEDGAGGTGAAQAAPKPDPLGELRDAPDDDSDPDATEEGWKQAVQQAQAVAQSQGKLSGGSQRLAAAATAARVDWRSPTLRWAQEQARDDYSWGRPNPRYMVAGLYLPALRSMQIGDLVIGIDTSASLDDVLIGQMQEHVRNIAAELQPRRIIVIYADAAVQSVEIFEQGDPLVLHPRGGGGTDFRPLFEYVEQMDEPPVGVIYLTDLWGTFPDRAPDVPVLWAATEDRPVPFGDKVLVA